MKKIGEFWLAYAGDALTASISLHDYDEGTMIKITVSGIMDTVSSFIAGVAIAIMDNNTYSFAMVDVRSMSFVDGIAINEAAIGCLIKIVSFIMSKNIRSVLVIDNDYVREVLSDILKKQRGFSGILFMSGKDMQDD
ncbi:MAG: hypothetical protein WCK65_06115 [Rhodospirillaceae bacterium]